jgi:hypothetical protein
MEHKYHVTKVSNAWIVSMEDGEFRGEPIMRWLGAFTTKVQAESWINANCPEQSQNQRGREFTMTLNRIARGQCRLERTETMDTSTQAQTEFVSETERKAWNELQGILRQHPAEIAANNEYTRIYNLLDIIEQERINEAR